MVPIARTRLPTRHVLRTLEILHGREQSRLSCISNFSSPAGSQDGAKIKAMSRKDLAKIVREAHPDLRSAAEADRVVGTVFDTIAETVAQGTPIRIAGFGSFEKRQYAQRKGFNPNTQEEIIVPATCRPKFTAYSSFKDVVKN